MRAETVKAHFDGRWADFYARFVELSPARNGSAKISSPFRTDDRNPSFQINFDGEFAGRWHDYGTGDKGDCFDFYIRLGRAQNFLAAVDGIAREFGLADPTPKQPPAPKPVKTLAQRGISEATARAFQITEAPGDKTVTHRITFPLFDRDGNQIGTKTHKASQTKGNTAQLYPWKALQAEPVYMVNGEPGVWRCWEAGHRNAICGTGGEGVFKAEWAERFQGKVVRLVLDNDGTGRTGMAKIAKMLHGLAASVELVQWPEGWREKGDVEDWLNAGHSLEDLAFMPYEPAPGASELGAEFGLNDTGNAARFAAQHANKAAYCYDWNTWLIYDGKRYARDRSGIVLKLAKKTAKSIADEAAACTDDNRRADLYKHAGRALAGQRLREMLNLAQPELAAMSDAFDRDPWVLNVENGTLDLRTGELRPHRREDLLTKLAPVHFDPHADCPIWLAFLNRVFDGNADLVEFVKRAAGYSLTGDNGEQVLFILYGLGANGKSTFLSTVESLLGDYATPTAIDTLMMRRNEGTIPNDVARLCGARLVTATETGEYMRLNEGKVKALTGGDTITARFLHAEYFDFKPHFKIWIGCNHKPRIAGTDYAIWRRIRLIPFEIQIPEAERDPTLPEKLRAELPGILNWALAGCIAWQADGLGAPDEIKSATENYRSEMDTIGAFIEDCCFVSNTANARAAVLYKAYSDWCVKNGEKGCTQRALGTKLSERGFVRYRAGGGHNSWQGIGLRDTEN